MNSQDLITTIVTQMQIISPLKNAIDVLTSEIIDEEIHKIFVTNSIVLIKDISKNHNNINVQEKDLINALEISLVNLVEYYNEWIIVVNDNLFNGVVELIENNYDFNAIEIKNIIDYIISTSFNNEGVFKKIFDKLTSFGNIIPMETFGIGMYILELHGHITKNTPIHPDYTYEAKNDIQHEFRECIVCGKKGKPYLTAYSYEEENFTNPYLPFKLSMECSSCNNCYTRYVSSRDYNSFILSNLIMPQNGTGDLSELNSNKLKHCREVLTKMQKINTCKELLQIGINHGEFISVALDMGYYVEAIEICEEKAQAVANTVNIPIAVCDLIDFEVEDKYPIIIIEGVIEKTLSPIHILYKVFNLLADDGVLWLTTSDYQSEYALVEKENFTAFKDPVSTVIYSLEGLEKLLDKCDFEIIEHIVSEQNAGFMELLIQKK